MLYTAYERRIIGECRNDIDLLQTIAYNESLPHLIEYYAKLLRLFLAQRAYVVDIHAGLGDLCIYLAQNGYAVKGIFPSSKLLRLAQAKARQANVAIDFGMRDVEHLSLEDSAGAILIPNCIQGILSVDELKDLFGVVYRHLHEYGVVIMDFPTVHTYVRTDEVYPLGAHMKLFRENTVIRDEKVVLSEWHMISRTYTHKNRCFYRIYDADLVTGLLTQVGFQSVRCFDASGPASCTSIPEACERSTRIICVARRGGFEQYESEV